MRRLGRYRAGRGKNVACLGSTGISVVACRRHEGSARRWCWKRRDEMHRLGRAFCAALSLESILLASGPQSFFLCHQVHASALLLAVRTGLGEGTVASSKLYLYFLLPLKAG